MAKRVTYEEIKEFNNAIKSLRGNCHVQDMKKYIQHGDTSTYDHCMQVTKACFKIDKKLKLKSDREALLRGAFLHDFYLYDWHDKYSHRRWHGYHHADTAVRNAKKHFDIGQIEHDIIYSHMWPLNITRVPKRREAWIVCMADKYVSLKEIFSKK